MAKLYREPQRLVNTSLSEILSLVSCGRDYGFEDEVLFDAFAEWTGWVKDYEIDEYVAWYVSPEAAEQGYTQEDADEIAERLVEWRGRYCGKYRTGGSVVKKEPMLSPSQVQEMIADVAYEYGLEE